ncbi:MAG: arylsulfatase family protein [Acidimicrobiales bacterium]|nr:arylsulfatase family protein [Acidimicrobiales bacterium]
MGRKILFVTTDQQRYDALGCNGGTIARTPVVDRLAAEGVRYSRGHCQAVVCMPSRSTMLTGQYPRTHGVWMNGVPLPVDAPSVASWLRDRAGYRTALFGKPHFEPFLDAELVFTENQLGATGTFGPHRGFEHMETATHAAIGFTHYAMWMMRDHADDVAGFFPVIDRHRDVNGDTGGDTGAVQVRVNPVPRDRYHTDWLADRAIAWLDTLDPGDDWFCWLSFPDPHHPWDPPASERSRVNWRDLDLPPGYPIDVDERVAILDAKPAQWRGYYEGDVTNYEAPPRFVPAAMTPDQVREINALAHVENELIDEALGRVLQRVDERGWADDTDVIFTTDHGELQGDFGLLFKGPYHVDALMRVPFVWRPAPSAGIEPAVIDRPVGHIDLAPTFCRIAGVDEPDWIEGEALPADAASAAGRERVLTEWDSEFRGASVHLRTIARDGWVCTACEPGTRHDGTEGELYDLAEDPMQRVNRWGDPACRPLRDDLVADLYDHLPPAPAERRPVVADV